MNDVRRKEIRRALALIGEGNGSAPKGAMLPWI